METDDTIEKDEIAPEYEHLIDNMMVIDEYDAVKPSKSDKYDDSSKKRVMDAKDLHILERRYTLPSSPHIIIHPSKIAKSGKFDCSVTSLSILLDYRPDDTKEHSFEVSLFAELFNEMLMRDFGFNIYKALFALPEKVKETKKDEEAKSDDKTKKDSDIEIKDKDVSEIKDDGTDAEKKKKDDKDGSSSKDKDRDRESKGRSRHHDDENSEDDNHSIQSSDRRKSKDRKDRDRDRERDRDTKEKEKEKDRQKYYTADLDLLLSFVYFDQSQCGYIFEKDVEELFYTLGLNLSRSQTRKLVGKVVSRDSLYYRKLTDLPKEDDKPEGEEKDDEEPELKKVKVESTINEIELAKGNRYYLPIFKDKQEQPSSSIVQESDNKSNEPSVSSNGMVKFNGCLYDIEQLLDQMKRSEQAREETEKMLFELRKQNTDLNTNYTKSQTKIKDLSSDLKNSNRKLSDVEVHLSGVNVSLISFMIYDVIKFLL